MKILLLKNVECEEQENTQHTEKGKVKEKIKIKKTNNKNKK